PEAAVRGGGGAVSASIRRRRAGYLHRPPPAGRPAVRDGAARERGRRRSAYEAPHGSVAPGPVSNGAESKRRRCPRSRARQSRVHAPRWRPAVYLPGWTEDRPPERAHHEHRSAKVSPQEGRRLRLRVLRDDESVVLQVEGDRDPVSITLVAGDRVAQGSGKEDHEARLRDDRELPLEGVRTAEDLLRDPASVLEPGHAPALVPAALVDVIDARPQVVAAT